MTTMFNVRNTTGCITRFLVCVSLLIISSWTSAADKPNILLIVLDDAGYSDVAGFGRNDAPTPQLKKIADEGVRFTRHYADSTCRPARLALMTGRESARVAQNPDFRGISPELITLPEALKSAGYSTHHVGKWHLGDSVRESWPDQQGFDSWFGFLNQFQLKGPDENGLFTKRPTYTNPFLQGSDDAYRSFPGHLEDILAERVSVKIRDLAQRKKSPWFINYWTFAPHHPTVAAAEYLKQFPDTPAGKYQALLAQVDTDIGRVIQTLRETGQLDHTLIVLTSDNGGTNQMMNNNAPFAGIKGGFEEGSLRTPLIIRWPDKRHAGETRDAVVAIQDIYPTLLAAAGVKPVSALDGQDLQPLLEGKSLQPRLLVNEIIAHGNASFSVLLEDGNWRATPEALFDLKALPTGERNIAEQSQQKMTELSQRYRQWRDQKISVPLIIARDPGTGRMQVTGDRFRRAPGYGAYSVALGMQWPFAAPTTLISQQGTWSLSIGKNVEMQFVLGEDSAASPPIILENVKKGSCVPVVFTSYFSRSRLHEGKNTGRAQVYVNHRLVLEKEWINPLEPTGALDEPTWVGQVGMQPSSLGTPSFFNAELADANRNPWDEYSIQEAGQAACQQLMPLSVTAAADDTNAVK